MKTYYVLPLFLFLSLLFSCQPTDSILPDNLEIVRPTIAGSPNNYVELYGSYYSIIYTDYDDPEYIYLPEIDWGNESGELDLILSFVEPEYREYFSFNQERNGIKWADDLPVSTHNLAVSATNSAGSLSIDYFVKPIAYGSFKGVLTDGTTLTLSVLENGEASVQLVDPNGQLEHEVFARWETPFFHGNEFHLFFDFGNSQPLLIKGNMFTNDIGVGFEGSFYMGNDPDNSGDPLFSFLTYRD